MSEDNQGREDNQNIDSGGDPGSDVGGDRGLARMLAMISGGLFAAFALIIAFSLVVGSNEQEANKPEAVPQPASPAPPRSKLAVSEGEMFIRPRQVNAKAGKVTITATNTGSLVHEFIVLKTDRPADSLGQGITVSTPGLIKEIKAINPGKAKRMAVKLSPGHYVLLCNLPGHYAAGMHADMEASK